MTNSIGNIGSTAGGRINALGAHAAKLDKARQAAQNGNETEAVSAFQTVMSTLLVKEMRTSLENLTGEGPGSDVYSGWFDEHLGRVLADQDALGLAGMLKASVSKAAEQGEEQG